jgi:hypothetical protein
MAQSAETACLMHDLLLELVNLLRTSRRRFQVIFLIVLEDFINQNPEKFQIQNSTALSVESA